jgi:rare lipoprotein A
MSKKIRKGLLACLFLPVAAFGRGEPSIRDSAAPGSHHEPVHRPARIRSGAAADGAIKVQYGTASYYANKFEGRKTYTDEIFSQEKLTGASNTLPMHTWVRVTNLRNHRSVIVQINDKMHPRNRRLIDLSRAAAARLGYAGRGLTRVRVDVLGKKKPAEVAGDDITKDKIGQD